MKILLVGAGGVGGAITGIAARRPFFDSMVVADYDEGRAQRAAQRTGDPRFSAISVDASDEAAVATALREHECDVLLNATDPRFVMPLFRAALSAGAHYLDMAMSLSRPNAEQPYALTGVKLGDEQFELSSKWDDAGRLALVGFGVEPGLSDVFARYAADHLFSHIDEVGIRDGANLTVEGYDFAPTFSIWTTIEECLNPPVIWERNRGWYTTEPFSEPEVFDFPEGIGPVECVNVEHEEVLLVPRWVDAERVTFKYGLGDEFIGVLKTLHKIGLDRVDKIKVGGVEVPPVTWSPPACRTRPRSVTGCGARPVRAPMSLAPERTATRERPTSTTSSTMSGRCANTGRRRSSGRPQSIPSSPSSSSPPVPGRVPASSVLRRSTRSPTSTCS